MDQTLNSWLLKLIMPLAFLPVMAATAAEKKILPKEDVVDVPAIGKRPFHN